MAGLPVIEASSVTLDNVSEDEVELRGRVADRDLILPRTVEAMKRDMDRIKLTYLKYRNNQPNDRQAAMQEAPDGNGRLTVLGVPPVEPDVPDVTQLVEYLDRSSNTSSNESDQGLSRMFWRGDLQRTCQTSLANDAAVLHQLKDSCIQAAAEGGDSEYCTACVALAELHIPLCGGVASEAVADSKCSAVGVRATGVAAPGLPAWWFNNAARRLGTGALPDIYQKYLGAVSAVLLCRAGMVH